MPLGELGELGDREEHGDFMVISWWFNGDYNGKSIESFLKSWCYPPKSSKIRPFQKSVALGVVSWNVLKCLEYIGLQELDHVNIVNIVNTVQNAYGILKLLISSHCYWWPTKTRYKTRYCLLIASDPGWPSRKGTGGFQQGSREDKPCSWPHSVGVVIMCIYVVIICHNVDMYRGLQV